MSKVKKHRSVIAIAAYGIVYGIILQVPDGFKYRAQMVRNRLAPEGFQRNDAGSEEHLLNKESVR